MKSEAWNTVKKNLFLESPAANIAVNSFLFLSLLILNKDAIKQEIGRILFNERGSSRK